MKQFIILFVAAVAFIACEPVVNNYSIGTIYTAEQLDIEVLPVIVDGKQSNKIILKNNTPILCEWNYGAGLSRLPVDTVMLLRRGDINITFTGLNADGSKITKIISVTVEELSFPVSPEWEYLCGPTGEKEWIWDETWGFVWGSGPYRTVFQLDDYDSWWWAVSLEEIDDWGNMGWYFDPAYGEGASMKFSILNNAVFSKTSRDGTLSTGSFSLNMNKVTYTEDGETVWAKGKLSLSGTTILLEYLYDWDMDDMLPDPMYEFDIIELEEDRLVLAAAPAGSAPEDAACFWIFKPK
ncbi:MAG: hypothetical protein LBH58_12295 [Tannerellaceae bacterium]|jgi:hypothetical protein|nr:hypothetical protein [Tannerellaceae bacterium]